MWLKLTWVVRLLVVELLFVMTIICYVTEPSTIKIFNGRRKRWSTYLLLRNLFRGRFNYLLPKELLNNLYNHRC